MLIRTAAGALGGAAAAVAALVTMVALRPAIVMDMDRDAASVVRGLHGVERVERETYAWTRGDVRLALPGLDRRGAWTCTIRLRGGRADVSTLPLVTITVDGLVARTHQSANEYHDVTVTLPPRPQGSGAAIGLTSSNTFQPGPDDPRVLGVMIDHWVCEPSAARLVVPAPRALRAAAIAGGVFGAALAVLTTGVLGAAAAVVVLAIAQAVPLAWGFGMFTRYPDSVAWLAVAMAALLVGATFALDRLRGRPMSGAARFVAAFTVAVLFLKLIALLHPSKPPIDVVFHAHRLQWVLEGRYYFTQLMPSGVRFPYAIGLYVFSAPWSLVTNDYVLLLRIVVSAAEASGAVLLYLLVSRLWRDPVAGAAAAALFAFVPRLFEIVGNANMTNAFGQSAALATVAAAVLWPLDSTHRGRVVALTALTAFALLCHISTFTQLPVILLALALLYWRQGGELRGPAVSIVTAVAIAAVFSVAVYYGHFGDAYRTAARVRAAAPSAETRPAEATRAAAPSTSLSGKSVEAARLSVAAVGWPIFVLAIPGAIWLLRRRGRDRLTWAVAAWAATYAVFVVSVLLTPVDRSFQRYASEFISRVTLATHPAVVILAGMGAATLWRAGALGRAAGGLLLLAAAYTAADAWIEWLR